MGVFIKGMEMPKGSCEWVDKDGHLHRCKLLNGDDDCKMQEGICADATWEEQFANCPLIEIQSPHGRLIDADALLSDDEIMQILTSNPQRTGKLIKEFAEMFVDKVNRQPTIIEGGEK